MSLAPELEGKLQSVSGLVQDLWGSLSSAVPASHTSATLASLLSAATDLQASLDAYTSRIALHNEYLRLRTEIEQNTARLSTFASRSYALDAEIHALLRQLPLAPPLPRVLRAPAPVAAGGAGSAADESRRLKRKARAAVVAQQPGSLGSLYRTAIAIGYRPYEIPLARTVAEAEAIAASAANPSTIAPKAATSASSAAAAPASSIHAASSAAAPASPSLNASVAAAAAAAASVAAPPEPLHSSLESLLTPVSSSSLLSLASRLAPQSVPALRPPALRAGAPGPDDAGPLATGRAGEEAARLVAPVRPPAPDPGTIAHAKQNPVAWPLEKLARMVRDAQDGGCVEFALEPGWREAQEKRREEWKKRLADMACGKEVLSGDIPQEEAKHAEQVENNEKTSVTETMEDNDEEEWE